MFSFAYAETTAIWDEVMKFEHLKQLPREAAFEFIARVNTIVYLHGI